MLLEYDLEKESLGGEFEMGRFVFAFVALGLGLTLIFGYPFENGLLTEDS